MLSESLILNIRRQIDNTFVKLQRILSTYSDNESTIEANLERLQNIRRNTMINPLERSGLELILMLSDTNARIKRINDNRLREIDNYASIIAGYLSVLLDECIHNYSPRLKVIIRLRLQRLSDLREIKVGEGRQYLVFPSAVALLTPYVIKTRLSAHEENLRSVRSIIRTLSEPSF